MDGEGGRNESRRKAKNGSLQRVFYTILTEEEKCQTYHSPQVGASRECKFTAVSGGCESKRKARNRVYRQSFGWHW